MTCCSCASIIIHIYIYKKKLKRTLSLKKRKKVRHGCSLFQAHMLLACFSNKPYLFLSLHNQMVMVSTVRSWKGIVALFSQWCGAIELRHMDGSPKECRRVTCNFNESKPCMGRDLLFSLTVWATKYFNWVEPMHMLVKANDWPKTAMLSRLGWWSQKQ